MSYVLALDQGTTSSRAILFSADGKIVAQSHHEFEQIYPNSGWVEHAPFDILTSQLGSAVEAWVRLAFVLATSPPSASRTSARRPLVWDRETGKPVYNAIVWQDRRTAPHVPKLTEARRSSKKIRESTGLRIDPYFSATKIAWILDNVAGARAQGRGGKACVRHGGYMADLESHQRQ